MTVVLNPTVRALTCPACGGTIALRAAGQSVSLVCEHCGSTIDATDETPRLIAAATEAMHRLLIPLGTRGTLDGVLWEAVGYLERTDGEEQWSEYLLFNPYESYAFLIDDGHRFSLGKLLDRMPQEQWHSVLLDGRRFRQGGDPYPVRVRFVVGEFYWRVEVGEVVTATDYAADGTMLSCEENGAERSWTRLDLLPRGTAERAFGIRPRGRASGARPALHEPSPYARLSREAIAIGLVASIVMLGVAIGNGGSRRLLATEVTLPIDAPSQPMVVGPITIPRGSSRVAVHARADGLDNGWIDLDYALVDRRTQARYDAYTTAESYRGRDSDGAWSEGDARPDIALSAIPAGSYDLVIEGAAHRWTGAQDPAPTPAFGTIPTVPVTVMVDRGGIFGGNLLLAWLLIAIWPGIAWLLHQSWESQRKGND